MRDEAFGSGMVDLLVLGVLGRGESYGYAIARELDAGELRGPGEAAVYACLQRLHDRALLTSRHVLADNGKARRYYALSDAGRSQLAEERAAWAARRDAIDAIFDQGRTT